MERINLKSCIKKVLEAKLTGGESGGATLKDIAKKHGIDISTLKKQFEMGVTVEMEHTDDPEIAKSIAKDHVFENPEYYSMLKKMESTFDESALTFSTYLHINETALEDLAVSGEENTEENIGLLHEMEYKISKIIKNRWSVHPKLFKNVLIRFSTIAVEAYEVLEGQFARLFEWWQACHQIESASDFADMTIKEFEKRYGDDWLDEVNRYGVARGAVKLVKDDVADAVGSDTVYDILHDEYSSGMDIVEFFGGFTTPFIEENGVEIPEDTDDAEEFSKEYVTEHDLVDNFMIWLSENYKLTDLYGEAGLTQDMWRDAIENKLYPDYMANFGSAVETVHEEIAEHNERAGLVDVDAVLSKIAWLSETDPTDEKIEEVAEDLYTNGIAPMLRTISLAMNIDHVYGNISKDYGDAANINLDPSFYDNFHSRGVGDWDMELKAIIKPKRV